MINVTKEGNHTITQQYFCTIGLGIDQKIVISALNIPQSISAFLGNALIIVALQKVSSLHSASRLLLGCLAATDLGVGLITQPVRIALFMSPEHSKLCYYLTTFFQTIGGMFCAVSVLTTTAISVDRLLALMLGLRYRQVVTLRRTLIFVVSCWFFTTALLLVAFLSLGYCCKHCLYQCTIVHWNINFLLHENLFYASPSPNPSARRCSPKTTEWTRSHSEYSKLQKNSVQCTVDTDDISGLLSAI